LYRNLLFIVVAIALLTNVVGITAVSSNATNEVEVIGSSFKNSIAVNGTAVIGFLLKSKTVVLNVVVSYVDQQKMLVNGTMRLVEGNATYGWWKATIIPNVWEEKVDEETRYYIDSATIKLYVFLRHAVDEIAISESLLGYWSVKEESFPTTSVFVYPILGLVLAGVGATVALRARNRKSEVLSA